jgi:hypothetical protein
MLKKQEYINGARTVSSFSRINLIIKFFYNNETKLFVVEVRSIITDEIKTVDYFLPNEFRIAKKLYLEKEKDLIFLCNY